MTSEKALKVADTMHDWLIEETTKICSIPAPSFDELERARYVSARMLEFGLSDVTIDSAYNAVGILKGEGSGPKVLFAAHIDTVFPKSQDLTITCEPGKLRAPGIGDNASGVAGMLGLIRVLKQIGYRPPEDMVFVATSGEEGLGDLKGIKKAMEDHGHDVRLVIGIDGGLGNITHRGVGSRRFRVNVGAEGGHSFGAFGNSSAIHSMARMISRIADIEVPEEPRTTFNVGVISGGHSVNSIASQASMLVDMRSVSAEELEALESKVRAIIKDVCENDEVAAEIDVVGDRPAGDIPEDHPLVLLVESALAELGIEAKKGAGSTDANVPLSQGIPAVTIGLSTGGNAHRHDEWLDTEPLVTGLKQLIMVTLGLGSV